jgi:hypothetical protein
MMFNAHTAFACELLALVAGTLLLLYADKTEVNCKKFAKIVGYFTVVVSILNMLCTTYYTFKYSREGLFESSSTMMRMPGMPQGMDALKRLERRNMMMNNPMMNNPMMPPAGAPPPPPENR